MKKIYMICCIAALCTLQTGCRIFDPCGFLKDYEATLMSTATGYYFGTGTIEGLAEFCEAFEAQVSIQENGEECDVYVSGDNDLYFKVYNVPLSGTIEAVDLDLHGVVSFRFGEFVDELFTENLSFEADVVRGVRDTRCSPAYRPIMLDMVAEFELPSETAGGLPRKCTIRVAADGQTFP